MKIILELQDKGKESLLESLHWLFEAHDPGLVQKCMGDRDGKLKLDYTTLHPFDCYVLGHCIANSRRLWDLELRWCSINDGCLKMLTAVEKGRAFGYIRHINFESNNHVGCEGAITLGELSNGFHVRN